MGELDGLLGNDELKSARRPKPSHPKGWEPGVRFDPQSGEGEAVLLADGNDFAALLAQMLPEVPLSLVEVTEVRAWGDPDDPRKYVKCKVVRDGGSAADRADVEVLAGRIRRHRKRSGPQVEVDRALVVALSDWQVGKALQEGGGTPELVDRVLDLIDKVEDRTRALKKAGRPCGKLVVAGVGDTVEQCSGNYSAQAFQTDMNVRDQKKVARRLLLKSLQQWSRLFDEVLTFTVASNHGQNRVGNKMLTDVSDSLDLEIWESVGEVLAENPDAYGHVAVAFSDDPHVATFDVAGRTMSVIHGHQANGGGAASQKMWNWWQGQAMGQRAAGDADLLVAGHYHHPYLLSQGGRTLFGCPSLDGGSRWFTDASGMHSEPGTLSFTVDVDGWSDLVVL